MASERVLQYAATLRQQLVQDLFQGEELPNSDEAVEEEANIEEILGGSELSLQDVDKDLEEYGENPIIKGILEQGRVLKEYASEVDDRLNQTELESIQDYIAESDSMVALHDQIKSCDVILSGLEQVLGKFQADLGKVSEEIRQLQVQSQTMSTKLKNRRATEAKLGTFIENLTVSEQMVNSILESEVNEEYLEYLLELDKKLKFVHEDEVARMSQATRDLEPALEKLRLKALSKVRDYVLQKIYMLKRPKTSVNIIQQTALLKNKYFVRFLRRHGQDIYQEIRSEYISIMSKTYSQHFRSYLQSMEKMQLSLASQADTLGAVETGGPAVNVLNIFKKDAGARSTTEHLFELGDRASVLQEQDKAIIPHIAEQEGRKFLYEVIFKNVHKLLIDTATVEYFFCLDFFEDESVFRELCGPMVQVVEGDLAMSVQDNWDMLSLLLMIRINHEHRKAMMKDKVPLLEDYLDRVHLLLWPRLKLLFDNQLGSVRSGTERTLFNESPLPHPVVKRYAALAASMLLLMAEYDSDAPGMFKAQTFYDMMDRLWQAMHDLLLRMSNMFRDKRTGIIFLITNYNHILTTLRAADAHGLSGPREGAPPTAASAGPAGPAGGAPAVPGIGKTGAAAMKEVEEQLSSCTNLYVEEQLMGHFPMLLEFVKKAEQQQKRLAIPEGQAIPNFAPPQASPILRDFAQRWQQSIEAMHAEVSRQFADPACGRDVLQASMTAFLTYYTRLLDLLKRQGAEGQAVVKDAVNIPAIMYEVRRLTKS